MSKLDELLKRVDERKKGVVKSQVNQAKNQVKSLINFSNQLQDYVTNKKAEAQETSGGGGHSFDENAKKEYYGVLKIDDLIKVPDYLKDNNRRFDDGFQASDILPTLGENLVDSARLIGSTAGEAATRIGKGILSVPENMANAGASLIVGAADLIGQDRFANALRNKVAGGSPFTQDTLGIPIHETIEKVADYLDKSSFTGKLLDSATEGIGQTFGQMAVSTALGNAGIGTRMGEIPLKFGNHVLNMPITAFLTGFGSSASETYAEAERQLNGIENATWREKAQMALKIVGGGTIEGITEGFFGLLGLGGTDITEAWQKKAIQNARTTFSKILTNIAFSGGGEAAEEFLSYAANWLWNNGLVNKLGKIDYSQNWNWSDVFQEMASAFISSGISQGGSTINQINRVTKNAYKVAQDIISKESKLPSMKLTDEQKSEIKANITNMILGIEEEIKNKSLYPETQKTIDQQTVNANIQANRERLRQKGYLVNEDNTVSGLSRIDQIRLKHGLPARNIQATTSQNMAQNNTQQQTIQLQNKNQNLVPNNSNTQTDKTTLNDDTSLFDMRDFKEVGSKNINAYQYDNPEVKPFFQQEAKAMLKDLNESIKGERYYSDENGWGGTQRAVIDDIAELLDGDNGVKLSYDDIRKGLNAIIEDTGAENNAKSKRIEFYLDKRLREGYTQLDGLEIPPDEDYLKFLQSMQSNETTVLEDKPLTKQKSSNLTKGYTRLYRGLNDEYNPNYDRSKLDNVNGYESWTDNYDLAKEYGENVYYIDVPTNQISNSIIDEDSNSATYGDRNLIYKNDKPVGINGKSGNEYMLNTNHDEYSTITYNRAKDTINKNSKLEINSLNSRHKESNIKVDKEHYKKYGSHGEIFEKYNGEDTKTVSIDDNYDINEITKEDTFTKRKNKLASVIKGILSSNYANIIFSNNGNKIRISNGDIDHIAQYILKSEKQRQLLEEHILTFEKIGDIIENAKLVSQEASNDNNRDVAWHYFYDNLVINNNEYKLIFDVVSRDDGENHYRLQSLERKNKVEPSVETDTNVGTSTLEGSTINNSITPKNKNVNTDETLENKMLEKTVTDSKGNELTKEQQERVKNSKIRDIDGKILPMYHGTNGDFYTFDIGKLGNNTKNAGNYGDGFYFTYSKERARDYGKNVKQVYLNITNPFSYESLYYLPNGEESYSDFTQIANLVKINDDWGKIPIKFGSKYTWQDVKNTVDQMIKNGNSEAEIDSKIYEKFGDIAEQGLPDRIYTYSKEMGFKTLRETLAEKGYDGIIDGKTPYESSQIVAFYPNQIKDITNKNPTDNPDIRYSKKLTQRTNTYIEELLSDKKFINNRIKNSLKNMFVPLKQDTEDFRKFNRSIDSIIDDSTDRIELLTKLNALTPDKISSIINEIANTGIAEREEKVITVKDYIIEEYGKAKWNEISSDMQEVLNNLQNKFTRELETVDKNLIKDAKENVTELLKNLNYTEEQIDSFLNGYANEYEKDMYSNLLDEIIYYSRPLEEIEASNYANIKRTNYLIEKRKWDLQHSGKITQEGYHNGVSFADMRKAIEKHLGKDIRLKGFRQRAYGIYNAKIDEIRIKDISEIETAIHELGHRIDFKELKRIKDNAKINSELNELCERAFKNSYDDKLDVKLQEGWAEFVRRFVTNNEATIQEYPNTSEFMLAEMQKNNNLKDVVVSLTDMVEKYIHSNSQTATQGLLSIGEQTDERKLDTKVIDFYDRFMERWFDDLWYAKKITKEIAKAGEKKYNNLNPEDNIYNLLRLNKANESRTIDIAKHGFYDDAGVKVVRGLGEILEPFSKSPKKLAEIRNLLLARRSIDYLAKNLGSGLGITDAMNVIKNTKDRTIINAVEEIEEFANYPFELAMQKGMITSEQYDEIKKWNKFYVPLKRVFDEQVNRSTGGKNNLSKLVQKRTGSQREVIDPLESIIQNTTFMLDKIYQNEVMNTLAKHAADNGLNDYYSVIPIPQQLQATVGLDLFKSVLQQQLGTQNVEDFDIDFDVVKNLFSPKLSDDKSKTLTYMDNGTLKAIQFYNDSLYNIFSGNMGKAQNVAEWLKTFDRMTGILRSGATASNVEFAIPNMISDTITAWVYSDNGFIPVVDTIRGIFDYASAEYGWGKENTDNKKLYSYYQQSGSPMSTRVGSYRTEVQDYLKEVIGKYATKVYSDDAKTVRQAVKEIIDKAKKLPNGIQDVLSILPELSEQATRFEYFKKSYNKWIKKGYTHKQAMLKAGIETKDSTLDFNRAGTYMRSINRLIAFSNASMQGTYRALEGIAKAPAKTLSRVGLLTLLFLGLKSMLGDDDDKLEEVPDNTKRDNFVFNFGGNVVKIKKPQDFLSKNILNFAETLYDVANGKVDDYNKSWRNLTEEFVNSLSFADIDFDKNIAENIGGNITPTSLKPLIEAALDHDFYYGNQITPYGTEKMSPQYQYDAYTSKNAIDIGQTRIAKLLGLSPTKIQHLIKGYGAGVGQQILDTIDSVKDALSDEITLPDKAPSEQFITRRFAVDPNRNSQSVSDVYDLYEELETKNKDSAINGIQLTLEEQETFNKLSQAKDDFSKINKQLKEVQSSLTMTSSEKREKIDELKALRTDVARYYLGKNLIDSSHKKQIELYEFYPAQEEYTYTPKGGVKVKVQYDEKAKIYYSETARKYYEEALAKEEKTTEYKKMTEEEKAEKRKSLKTSAKNKAKDATNKMVYDKTHKK